MKRETLKEYIDNIIIKKCGFEKTFFSMKSDNGQNMIVHKDILFDPLDAYEVLSEIERKCGILINDDLVFNPNITYGQYIDIFWDEIKKEHKNN